MFARPCWPWAGFGLVMMMMMMKMMMMRIVTTNCTGEDKYRDPASLSPLVEHVTVTSLLIKSLKTNCYCLLLSKKTLLNSKPFQAPLLNVRTATKY